VSVVTDQVKHEFDAHPVTNSRRLVRPVGIGLANNVINALGSLQALRVPDDVTQPAWLGDDPENREYIAVENGLLDVRAVLENSSDVLRPHTPEWFSPVCLPYGFDRAATCPRWTEFIQWMFKRDAELIRFVQEWFGYCLVVDHSQHKFILAVGEGANGKSVMLDTLKNLVGRENCSSVGLESFEGRFDLSTTIGKLVNVVSEIGDVGKLPEGKLKAFVGGDLMTFDRKHREPLQVNPTARLVFATNMLPKFADRSEGIWRRFVPLPCKATIADKDQDRELSKKMQAELPGIFNWALQGLKRLRDRGQFAVPEASKALMAEHRQGSHPELRFFQEECKAREGDEEICGDLYHRYQEWCTYGGHTALSAGEFGKALKRRFPGVDRKRRRRDGRVPWVYSGLGCS
jgi:P4 family phage/plasmid primase-like protien